MVQTQFLWCYGGTQVFLYDSFTGWTEQVPMILVEGSSTIFRAFRDLPAGCHQYKFLVDNVWRIDDQQPCLQDTTYGTINNYILVAEQEFIPPIGESFQPTMIIAKNGLPRPGADQASSSGSVQHGPMLSLSPNKIDVSRLHLSLHMSFYTTYDLLPESSKVFAFDVNCDVEDAFHVMYEQGLAVVPIWDEPNRQISGMLTASDFICLLVKLHKSRAVLTNEMLDMHTISAFKEGKHQVYREGAGSTLLPYRPLIQAGPDESLHDLALRIVQNRISAVPILDFMEDGSCPVLLHVACLAGILKHICSHFGHRLNYLPFLQPPVGSLRIGTWRTNVGSGGPLLLTLRPCELLDSALNLLIKAQISAIPIVDDNGALINVLSRRDITSLAKGSVYAHIQLDRTTIAQALTLLDMGVHNRYQICKRSDSLYRAMELLSDPVVRHLIVIDPDNQQVEGIITLRDVFTFFLS